MLKGIRLGSIALILTLSGFNGFAIVSQAYPNCEFSILVLKKQHI